MCQLTIARPKSGSVISLRTFFEKVPVQESLKKKCLAIVNRYVDDILVYNFKA